MSNKIRRGYPMVRNKRAQVGLSLIELVFAFGVMLVAIMGFLGAIANSMRSQRAARLHELAVNAARAKLEEMRQFTAFNGIFAAYIAGGTPGSTFSVTGLTAPTGVLSVGRVELPTVTGSDLREDFPSTLTTATALGLASQWGMPRDLNGNAAIDTGSDISSDYDLLPVQIVIEYQGVGGPMKHTLLSILSDRTSS